MMRPPSCPSVPSSFEEYCQLTARLRDLSGTLLRAELREQAAWLAQGMPKNRAENMMIVDLLRNDMKTTFLRRVASGLSISAASSNTLQSGGMTSTIKN